MNETITTTTTGINEYAETIIENRWMSTAQLSADDMGPTTWKQYRNLCDRIAIASWRSLHKNTDSNAIGLELTALLAFFGSDAKATTSMQKRILLACVSVKKQYSPELKAARKALNEAKKALESFDPNAPLVAQEHVSIPVAALAFASGMNADKAMETATTTSPTLEGLKNAVDNAQAKVDELRAMPKHEWYDKVPMLDASKNHASTKCRKLIEDTIADILTERSLMTIEELQVEAAELKAARKARRGK